ncbi:MBG domain-containing protein, partial [Algoriphagus litoralis]|uniref:MBG domain-containing protein n=1 Tax=Algoriphagus litoralis TaxID=2202829 RepID=UPI0018E4E8EB
MKLSVLCSFILIVFFIVGITSTGSAQPPLPPIYSADYPVSSYDSELETKASLNSKNLDFGINPDLDWEIGRESVKGSAPLSVVVTTSANDVTLAGATLNGEVISDGGFSVTARGFVYSSTDNTPTIGEGGVTNVSVGNGTGAFSEAITGLSGSTTYYFQAYSTTSEGTSYGGVESFTVLDDTVDPEITLPSASSKSTDTDACYYTVVGTEFDPLTATDNSGSLASLTYSLKKLLPSPTLISENFNTGAWNPANFEIGSASGSVVNNAYRSANGDNRGTLRTVADFRPTAENPVYVSATLRFSGTALAFIGTRATGLKNPSASNEPLNALYFRIHNFNNGQTNLTSTSFDGRPGNSFYSNPIRVAFVDNGTNITGTFTNTVTNQVLSFNQNTSYSSGSWRVVFSGGTGVSWDDIKISFGPHEYIQEYDSGSNSLAGVELEPGEITVEWTATDYAGNSVSDSFLVTVADTQAPSLTVGESVEQLPESGTNLVLTIPDAVFSDNCSIPILTWRMSGAHTNSGTGQIGTFGFKPGSTKITYTLTDASGNTTVDSVRITNTYQYFPSGSGTEIDPYQITDWEHLYNVRFFSNKYFILMNDLDDSSSGYETYASSTANSGAGWSPGGYVGGINFDGQGFSISDLRINNSGYWQLGIFEYVYNSSFKNILLKDFQIEGQGYIGSIAGYSETTVFDNIQVVNGSVIASDYYGGLLVGGGYEITIVNSSVEGEISGDYYLGGFLGELYGGKIENSYANVSISGLQSIGGLVGYFYSYDSEISVQRSFAKGTVSGQSYLGGLIGQSNRVILQDVYSEVEVTGTVNYIGGISGTGSTIQLTNAYVTNLVSGPGEYTGVILGRNSSSVLTNVFWDKETSGIEESLAGGLGKTTAEMKTQSTFTDWDFDDVWAINPTGYISYPYFQAISYDELEASPAVNPVPGLEKTVFSQTITFEAPEEKTYGDLPFTLGDAQTDRGLSITYTAEDPTVVSITDNEATILKAGTTKITATQAGNETNFAAEPVEHVLTINQKELIVTVNSDQIKEYGENDPVFTFESSGFAYSEDESIFSGSLTRDVGEDVGDYAIKQGDLSAGSNYSITFTGAEFAITQKSLTITVVDVAKFVGESDPDFSVSYAGLVRELDVENFQGTLIFDRESGETAGTYVITASGLSSDNYLIDFIGGTLTILGPPSFTSSPAILEIGYGQEYSYAITASEEGDLPTKLSAPVLPSWLEFSTSSGALIMGTPAKSDLGEHAVTLRATNDAGFTEQEFVITVKDESAPVVVTYFPENEATEVSLQPTLTLSFDEEVVLGSLGTVRLNKVSEDGCSLEPIFEFDLSNSEDRALFVPSDDQLSISLSITENLPVNTLVTVEIPTGFVSDAIGNAFEGFTYSYTWYFTTINKNTQTITFPEIEEKTYGDAVFTLGNANTDQGLAVTYTATDPTVVSISGNQATILKAGSTTITATQTGDETNFAADPVERILNVGKKGLIITALNKTKVYGEANPTLTFTYEGLVNGDTKAATEPSISTTATLNSGVGTYPIQLTGAADANYSITLVDGELEVTQAGLIITATDKTKIYGEANPELTFTYTGLVNGDEKVATEPSISTTATQNSGVGTYPINLTGGSDQNYAITLVAGELEVTQAGLTITATDKTKIYGQENPILTFTYTGLVNGDEKVSTEPSISTTATASSAVGTYPINLTGGSDQNYAITLVDGELEVTQAALIITATDKTKVYGQANPELTFSYTGLVNGDTKVATEPSISTTATQSSGVGTY